MGATATAFEAIVMEKLSALEGMEDHENFDGQEFNEESYQFTLESSVSKALSKTDLMLLNVSENSTKSIRDLQFTEINDTARLDETDDILPDVEFSALEDIDDLTDAALSVSASVNQSHYAQATVDLFLFAERRYFSFLK